MANTQEGISGQINITALLMHGGQLNCIWKITHFEK